MQVFVKPSFLDSLSTFGKDLISSNKVKLYKIGNRAPTSNEYPSLKDVLNSKVILYDTKSKTFWLFSIVDKLLVNVDTGQKVKVNLSDSLLLIPDVLIDFSQTNTINLYTKKIFNLGSNSNIDISFNFSSNQIVDGLEPNTKALQLNCCHNIVISNIPVNEIEYITVSMMIYFQGDGMPFGFYNYDFYSCCGGVGFNTGHSEIFGINYDDIANKLVHLTLVFYKLIQRLDDYPKYNQIYVNGKLVDSRLIRGSEFTSNDRGITDKFWFSSLGVNTSYGNSSKIGDFKMFFRKLTGDEVATLYNMSK